MGFTLVQSVGAYSTTGNAVTTSGVDTTGADLLVAIVSDYVSDGSVTISDSKSNIWTALTEETAGISNSRLFYAKNATVGSGHTFTGGISGSFPAIAVLAFSGSNLTAPFVQQSANYGTGTSIQAGSLTTTNPDLLVFGNGFSANNSGFGVDSGFTNDYFISHGANNFGVAISHLIQGASGAINPTASWTSSTAATALLADFVAAAGGLVTVNASPGTLNWSGVTSSVPLLINATPGTFNYVGALTGVPLLVNASPGVFNWAATQATVPQIVLASLGTLNWSGTTASFGGLVTVNAIPGTLNWSGVMNTIPGIYLTWADVPTIINMVFADPRMPGNYIG